MIFKEKKLTKNRIFGGVVVVLVVVVIVAVVGGCCCCIGNRYGVCSF